MPFMSRIVSNPTASQKRGRICPTHSKINSKNRLPPFFPSRSSCLRSSLVFTPVDAGTFVLFLIGVLFLIFGMGAFTLGADLSMLVIGEKIGSVVTHSRKVWLIALISFLIGILVTVAEPDLQILAEQVPAVENYLLILTVAVGVGIFLMIAMLRIVFRIRLSVLLIIFYAVAFLLSFFVPSDFWAVAFDSGGVTTAR